MVLTREALVIFICESKFRSWQHNYIWSHTIGIIPCTEEFEAQGQLDAYDSHTAKETLRAVEMNVDALIHEVEYHTSDLLWPEAYSTICSPTSPHLVIVLNS